MDIYEGKKIHLVRTKETEPFVIRCNLSLAQILVSNLVKNSLVHNREGGELHIATTPSSLTIMNSGEHPLDGEKLFRRFYRRRILPVWGLPSPVPLLCPPLSV